MTTLLLIHISYWVLFFLKQCKFYLKTAKLSNRCFDKVLQIDVAVINNALLIGNSQKCTQATFKDLLYLEEADQHHLLLEMAEGKLTVAELRKRMVSYT